VIVENQLNLELNLNSKYKPELILFDIQPVGNNLALG